MDIGAQNIDAALVLASPGNNQVGELLGGLDELLMHGFHIILIMIEHHINRAPTLHDIATDVTNQTNIAVGIDENLQVHHVAQLLIMQRHDAFEDNHGLGFYMNCLRQTVGEYIRIGGLLDGLAIFQLLDLLRQQFPVEGIRMVEVNGLALFISQCRRIVVIRIQRNDGSTMGRQRLGNTFDDGGLARTRTACNTDDDHFCSLIK